MSIADNFRKPLPPADPTDAGFLRCVHDDPKLIENPATKGISPGQFKTPDCGELWEIFLALHRDGQFDPVFVLNSIEDRKSPNLTKSRLLEILNCEAIPENALKYAELIARREVETKPLTSPDEMDQDSGPVMFEPSGIYYDGPSGKYLVECGSYFRTYTRKAPVVTGLERYLRSSSGLDAKEARQSARDAVTDAEIDRHVEWSGNLAGYRKGLIHSADGKPMLVLTSPSIPDPAPGPAPVIAAMFRQAFPDHVQRDIFTGWLAGSYRSVRSGVHHPAPMLCLTGKPNTGKSLLAYIAKRVMGGRSANPHNSWFGGLPWNDDLCAAELLLLDDCQGSTDMRSRMNFGSAFKESVYAGDISMRKRHCSSLSVRPVWRVMVCCNDSPENLLILPPIGDDMRDKVILLKTEAITTPVDTSTPEGRGTLQRMIEAELPMLANHLDNFSLPDDLTDSRGGVLAWRHPDLVQSIDAMKPESRLEELLQSAFTCHLWSDLPQTLTASVIESRLIDKDSPVRDQAKALFGNWQAACGTYCGKLADGGSGIIQPADFDAHLKVRRFYVRRESAGMRV